MTFLAIEEWKPIPGYEGLYEASSFGKVKSLRREEIYRKRNGIISTRIREERILKPNAGRNNHQRITLCKDGKTNVLLLHRVIASAFIPNPEEKPNIDHIDTDPTNNCVWNLRWVTQHENAMNPLTRIHNSKSKMGHPYRGRPLTEEERKKISVALTGKKLSEEHKRKLSEAHKGKKLSPEHIEKVRQSKIGFSFSEESREKMSQSHKGLLTGKHWKMEGDKRVWY